MASIYTPPDEWGKDIEWNELTLKEQEKFLKLGYKPPEGSILHNNLGVDDASLTDPSPMDGR